jgi:hypothetical protein
MFEPRPFFWKNHLKRGLDAPFHSRYNAYALSSENLMRKTLSLIKQASALWRG